MRKMYGETLDELGNVISVSKSTVQGYESGRRMPDIATIKIIAKYYGKTIDEMINNKLYKYAELDSTKIVNMDKMIDAFLHILPVIVTDEACKNESFLKGVAEINNMINAFRNGMEVQGLVISEIVDYFISAVEDNIIEAAANIIWCFFFMWTQQYTDLEKMRKIQTRVSNMEIDLKELRYEYQKDEKKTSSKRKDFICEVDNLLITLISELKLTEQWSQLGDYYLALRYVFGLIDTGYSDEMNVVIGIQILIAFSQIGNKYSLDFLETSDCM